VSELVAAAIEWVTNELEILRSSGDGPAERSAAAGARFEGELARDPRARALARIGLSPTELRVVLLLTVIELDPDAAALFQLLHPAGCSTLAVSARVYGGRASTHAFRELGPTGILRRLAFIERGDGMREDVPESRRTWVAARRVIGFLLGDDAVDASLACIAHPLDPPARDVLAVGDDTWRALVEAHRAGDVAIVAAGLPGIGRATLLAAAAREHGIGVLEVDARRLAREVAALRGELRAVARECKLLGRAPLLADVDALEVEQVALVGSELAPLIGGPIFATCSGDARPALDWRRPLVNVEVAQAPFAQRARLWCDALAVDAHEGERIADAFPLVPALIRRAATAARTAAHGDVGAAVRTVLDSGLGRYARRVAVTQTWDDLVLPADQFDAIIELIARVRQRRCVYEQWGFAAKVGRGLGVSALFSGPPGTGKTMVAALISRELGLDLYQVDLARVVSKWIGETERNLAAVFDAAEAGCAAVLFDEADALFGKRSEVRSSNDRYANLETNYLLQRLESFTGICLLTSNHETSIDPAFLRRLSAHVRFELPSSEEQAHLWRAVLPPSAPVGGDVDVARLATRFSLSGGYIRNAALRAAFLAADAGTPITMGHLEHAARLECEAIGRIATG
jgi:ATPase family protein associated with various cellular activities (AAA)